MHKTFLILGFLSAKAFSLSKDDVRALVEQSPKGSYSSNNHGRLCETIGIAAIQEAQPDADVLNGVEYRYNGRVVGELDLVVLHDQKVTEVIEVKCMKSFSGAANKADDQLERFSHYIGRCDVDFSLDGEEVPCGIFEGPSIELKKMSYADAVSSGFDYDIGVTRKELLDMIKEN